jgi:sugar-specific transcriptional regulator TrmB
MDFSTLERIGLSQGEIKAYISLLKLGPSSSGAVSKRSGVSHSKVYSVLDRLEKKGLASHVDRNGVRIFSVVEPRKIKDYVMEKVEELEGLGGELDRLMPQLEAYHREHGEAQSVTAYQGFRGVRAAHEHTYLKLKKGEEYVVIGVPQYQPWEHLRYWVKDHRRRDKAGIRCRLLFNSDADRKLLKNRNSFRLCEARYLPPGMKTPAYFTIYKDTTLITIPSQEPVSVEIVSREIADAFGAYFREFWKRSKRFR